MIIGSGKLNTLKVFFLLFLLQMLEQIQASLHSAEEKRQTSITELSAKHQKVSTSYLNAVFLQYQ